jgi:NADPH-dependent glutamate synthase beta subunit-like oxidoreductase
MIPSGDAAKIVDAISVLRSMEGEDKPMLGRRVVVYGGGNTAIDVARTVKRMGAEPIIVYRRTRDKAPAHDFEIEEALQEGVMIKWLSTIKQAGDEADHHREDGARRQGLPAADRRVRNPGSRLGGAGPGPGRRPRPAQRRAGARSDQGRRGQGRPT